MKKNYLICAGAAAALAVVMIAVIGIGNKQDQSPETMETESQSVTVDEVPETDKPTDTTGIDDETTAIESEATTVIPIDISVPDIIVDEPKPEDTSNDVVIDPEENTEVTVKITEPAQRPEPPEHPVVTEPETLKNPDVKPTYEEKKTTVNPDSDRPKNGERKDGMIYIYGFGWIVDEGGGSVGHKMGEDGDTLTGNKVGEMG